LVSSDLNSVIIKKRGPSGRKKRKKRLGKRGVVTALC